MTRNTKEKQEPFVGLDDSQPEYVDPLGYKGIYNPDQPSEKKAKKQEPQRPIANKA